MPATTLLSLEERMDAQLRSFGYAPSDEEQPGTSLPRKIVRGGAVGVLGAGGVAAYQNRAAIAASGKGAARTGLKKTARAAGLASNALHRTAIKSSGVGMKAAGAGSSILQKTATGLRKVAKTFSRADADALIDLAERVAALELESDGIEFAEEQRSKLGVAATGGVQALYDQKKYRESGLVYRKRDALKDNLKGVPANYAAYLGTVGAGVGGAAALGSLAAKGKLPKGVIRKVGAKAGRTLYAKTGSQIATKNKAILGLAGVGSLAGVGAHLKVQHGSAEKRRKALLKQRLEGGS